ncbi:unnamed protein product [Somion occarium]|uniref:Mitochondrial intermembrane space import and assembly protein 40 n=1 Tax=Somion occarium TaxID=3059160 RepID=A0ABP1DJT9_9APHY
MLRNLVRLPIRRALHTASSRPRPLPRTGRVGLVLGASVATAAYLTWQSKSVALDAVEPSKKPLNPKVAVSPETLSSSDPVAIHHEPSLHKEEPHASSSTSAEPATSPKPSEEAEDEHDGASGGAFNPETGEINWDCPCLGGMAHGPCGMQFREAFSCFVFSEQEPKGVDCIEKFKAMQMCFREHPDVYGEDIMDDDDDEEPLPMPAVDSASPGTVQEVPLHSDPQSAPSQSSSPAEETTVA